MNDLISPGLSPPGAVKETTDGNFRCGSNAEKDRFCVQGAVTCRRVTAPKFRSSRTSRGNDTQPTGTVYSPRGVQERRHDPASSQVGAAM